MGTMSVPEAKAYINRLRNKGSRRTAREDLEMELLQAFVDGRPVTATRDHTPPKRKGWW